MTPLIDPYTIVFFEYETIITALFRGQLVFRNHSHNRHRAFSVWASYMALEGFTLINGIALEASQDKAERD